MRRAPSGVSSCTAGLASTLTFRIRCGASNRSTPFPTACGGPGIDTSRRGGISSAGSGCTGPTSRSALEAHIPPAVRDVHVDQTLRRPDPVVFLLSGRFAVTAVLDREAPLDAGEVDAPRVAGLRPRDGRSRLESGPGEGNLDCPGAVAVGRVVERSVEADGGA